MLSQPPSARQQLRIMPGLAIIDNLNNTMPHFNNFQFQIPCYNNLITLMVAIPINNVAFAVEIPLMSIALGTVALRIWSRIRVKGRLAADDLMIILGAGCAIARTVISCLSADDILGYDRKGPDEPSEVPYYQYIFERRLAYLFAVTLIRLSILTSYLRIFPPALNGLRRECYGLFLLTVALFITVLSVLAVSCSTIYKLWRPDWHTFIGTQCFSSAVYSYTTAIGDCVTDLLIFLLPLPYVCTLSKLHARQRFTLGAIFALGTIVCCVALVQVPFIMRREKKGTYFGPAINILVAIQISLAIVAASLPDMRALMRRIKEKKKGSVYSDGCE